MSVGKLKVNSDLSFCLQYLKLKYYLSINCVVRKMEAFGDKEYSDLPEFITTGIEAKGPEAANAFFVSDHSPMSVNSAPSNQEIRVNDDLRSVSHGLDMVTDASNNQHLLNSNLSHSIQRFQDLSTCSEDGGMNYTSQTDMSATTSQMVLDNSRLAGNHYESSNIKEPHFYNQGIQENRNLCASIGQNYASNVYILQSPHNANAPCEIPYSRGIAVDDILAVPGPSEIFQNTNESNLSEEKFHPMSPLEHNSADVDKKMLFCKFCEKEIAKHGVAHQGKNIYECCKCMYKSEVMHDLQMHIRMYSYPRVDHYYCNVCREVYTEKGSHDVVRKCIACGKYFPCKGLLEQHSEDHKNYFYSYCKLCGTKIKKHITKDAQKSIYECCYCKYTNMDRYQLQAHLCKHSDLRLFKCYVCSRRYKHERDLQTHLTKHEKEDSTT